MNFKVGDKVTCIFDNWHDMGIVENFVCPQMGEVCEIVRIERHMGVTGLGFKGYPVQNGYRSNRFRALDRDFAEDILIGLGLQNRERL